MDGDWNEGGGGAQGHEKRHNFLASARAPISTRAEEAGNAVSLLLSWPCRGYGTEYHLDVSRFDRLSTRLKLRPHAWRSPTTSTTSTSRASRKCEGKGSRLLLHLCHPRLHLARSCKHRSLMLFFPHSCWLSNRASVDAATMPYITHPTSLVCSALIHQIPLRRVRFHGILDLLI